MHLPSRAPLIPGGVILLAAALLFLSPATHAQEVTAPVPAAATPTPAPTPTELPSNPKDFSHDLYWALDGRLDDRAPTRVYAGGQNFSWCCLKAVEAALTRLDDGTLAIANGSRAEIAVDNVQQLREAIERSQFPCNAKFNEDPRGAPVVRIQYQYLAETCPGWELSSQGNLNAWLHSLSGFLLPAVIFCLSVPRRRKLYIFRSFFVADLAGIKSYVPAILGAVGAGIIVAVDTIGWLAVCFAFAAPMIISGLYEAMLDNRILEFLREKIHNKRLTLDMRCRCLMIILIGNLDLALGSEPVEEDEHRVSRSRGRGEGRTERVGNGDDTVPVPGQIEDGLSMSTYPSHDMPQDRKAQRAETLEPAQTIKSTTSPRDGQLSSTHDFQILPNPSKPQYLPPPSVPSYRRESEASAAHTINRSPTVNLVASPWRHMEKLLYGIRLFDGDDHIRHESPRQCPRASYNGASLQSERPLPRTEETDRQILKTKTRLRSMLQCQYSFGSIVGAPVIFFLGGFVFSFLSSLDNLGDEDIAESIAFGSWYMIIPHIAIVSGLLLAGNNPNILEGVFATERDEEPDAFYLLGLRFDLVYPSCYKTAWQWHRGHTKRRWIEQLLRVYGRTVDADRPGERADDDDLEQLRGMTALGSLDWFLLLGLTYLLVGVPYVLAFLMAYFTPQIGLSCRSLTLTVYFCTQTAQLGLWLWAYAGPPPARRVSSTRKQARSWHLFDFARRGGWLHRKGFYDPSNLDWLLKKDGRRQPFWTGLRSANLLTLRAMWCATYYVLSVVFGIGGIFTSLGGTLMQIMGVYRTAMCYTNVPHWLQPYADRPMVVLSVNTEEMIDKAVIYWRPCAITAIVFMAGVSFIGWWYQRRMRDMFSRMVKKIDDAKFECVDAKAARQQGLSRGVSPLMKGVGM